MRLSAPSRALPAVTSVLAFALTVTLTLVLGLLTAPAAAAAGHHHQPGHHPGHHGRPLYLALGDSVPFGYRPSEVTTEAEYQDPSNFVGFPEVLAPRLHLRLRNASCPGETTASFLTAGAQSNGCENSVGSPYGYRSIRPLHVSYPGTQLAYAERFLRQHRRTRLVTIMIGANDLFVCQSTTSDQCTGSDFAATLGAVEGNLDTILGDLRAAHYRHRVVVVDYYSLDYGDAVGTGSTRALDDALARAAARHHAVVADGFGAFQRAAAGSDGDSCAAGLLIALPGGGCNVHPTLRGQRLLAGAVRAALRG